MKKVLAIQAHPFSNKKSRSMKVFYSFLEEYKKNNGSDSVRILNLYEEHVPEINGDMLLGWEALKNGEPFSSLNEQQQTDITRFNELTEEFLAADKIIIGNALWNLNVPTKLKAWFDTINVAGKTFKYTEAGPVPLTEGKKALHIQSNGGVFAGSDFSAQYVKAILNFLGVEEIEQIFIEGIDHQPEQGEEILGKALKEAKQLSQTF